MKRRLVLLGTAALLSGCASRSVAPAGGARLWSGRLGLQVQGDPPQQWHALFELQGSGQTGELQLLSPVGHLLARLSWDERQAVLERNSERHTAPTVQDLMQRLTRTAVPVQALFDWLEGRAMAHGGWEPDLGQLAQGRISARRTRPEPTALLRIVLDQ